MSEIGSLDAGLPPEISNASESISEEAQQRFAANAQALRELKKQEKKSKKKDDTIAAIIIQFLSKPEYAHLFVLISRLVGRNCPSIFILAILSLIHEDAKTEVNGYIAENYEPNTLAQINANMPVLQNNAVTGTTNTELIEWITRIQMAIALDADGILKRLLIDESNIDGALLQLTSFVIQEFFTMQQKNIDFKAIQPLAGQILQTVLTPHIGAIQKQMIQERLQKEQQEQD